MSEHDVSRRDFLKRGAVLGGAIVWTTPVVQAIGMRPAFAASTSPVCEQLYAVKIEIIEDPSNTNCADPKVATGIATAYCCENIDGQTATSPGQCLDVPPEALGGGCAFISAVNFENDFTWHITFGEDCFYQGGLIELKGGNDPCEVPNTSYNSSTRTLTVRKQVADAPAISHVEFLFCCDH